MTGSETVWADIPGYEGRYQASTAGEIRSLDRRVAVRNGYRVMKGRVLKPAGQKTDPHLRVVLEHGGTGQCVHTLVALTFLGPRPDGMDVRHLDGNPLNNRVSNLAYGSRTENILDVMRIGKPWRKLTTAQVMDIKRRLSSGCNGAALARDYGVSQSTISAIKRGRTFAWV